jgi:hypothetical protein
MRHRPAPAPGLRASATNRGLTAAAATVLAVRTAVPRGVPLVLAVQAASVALVAGWFATGHASAPDSGLLQLDVLSLHERVPGVDAVGGRPTMVVAAGQGCADAGPRRLDARYGLVVSSDPDLARRLALPAAAVGCSPGYVLLTGDGVVRYRSYDPGWAAHAQEQEILLENLEGPR